MTSGSTLDFRATLIMRQWHDALAANDRRMQARVRDLHERLVANQDAMARQVDRLMRLASTIHVERLYASLDALQRRAVYGIPTTRARVASPARRGLRCHHRRPACPGAV